MSVFNPKSFRQKTVIHGKAIPSFFLGLLLLLSVVPSFSQNPLNNAGLSSATPAASAYSLRRLSSSYSGSAIQVRRSSDNTTQNIGFSGNDLDTASLKTFVGVGDGFVTIWYDQSGNARNLTQIITARQPSIVNSGNIFRRNTKPTVYFDNADDGMVFAGNEYIPDILTSADFSVNVIAGSNANTVAFRRAVQGSSNWLVGPYNNQHAWFNSGWSHQISTPWSTTNNEVFTVLQRDLHIGVENLSWRNGVSQSITGTHEGNLGSVNLGTGFNGVEPLDGFISEVISFNSALSTVERSALEANQTAFYPTTAVNNALHFDGVDDFVNCGTSSLLDIRSSMTVELWIRPTTNMGNGKWDRLVHRNFGTGYFFGGKAGSTNALAVVLNNNINLVATPNNTVTVNEWQHVAFVFDDAANTVKIYRNGIEVASATYTGAMAGGNFNCTLSENSAEAFGGAMDEVRIWNVARTQAQLQSTMGSSISAATTGLVAYYNFNQGNPGGTNTGLTTLVDATSNAINGTLSGFALTGTTSNWITSTVFGTLSNNADLSNLTTTAGTLTPSFAAATTAYTASVANATTSVTVTPTRAEANATIQVRVNGGSYSSITSGSASGALALNAGNNTIDILVTAQNATSTKVYTITVIRAASTNADLSALTTTAGSLTPSFAAATTAYTASVANSTTSVTLTPTVADATATMQVQVNGGAFTSVTSGSASGNLALNVGSNTINITVTAQDGITTKTYTITVTRTPIVPTISSFSPLSAKPGDAVTITGTNFNSTAANNIVFFGATRATVTAATATSVTATVPVGAKFGPIALLNSNTTLMAQSALKFNATYSPPKSSFGASDLTPRVDISSGALSYPYDVSMADIDGDGKLDIIVVVRGTHRISIFRNISNTGSLAATSFADKVDFLVGTVPYAVAVADLDGDGKQDIAVANASSNNVSVLRNISSAGSISLEAAVNFSVGNGPQSIAIGDIDGDGKPDIITANHSARNIAILRNVATSGTINSSSFLARVNTSLGSSSRPTSVALADVDIDGKLDIIVANSLEHTVAIFRNLTSIGTIDATSLATKVDLATGEFPASVATADIDGDGKLDIITANGWGNSISVHRNISSSGSIAASSFSTHVEIAAGTSPKALALGDIDGDGKVDVGVVNNTSNTVTIFRNQATSGTISTSSFAVRFHVASGSEPFAIAIGDLDNDGRQDIAVANSDEHNISIYKNIASDADLRNLVSTVGNILPTFSAATTSYALQVAGTTSSISLVAVRADSAATMQVRINAGSYSAVTSGVPSQQLSLNVGNNTVEILVTAENGSTKTYTVSVTRLEPAPIVQGFTPMHAKPGDVVTITGTNFNSTAANNIVFFGATRATVTAATSTSVSATVPVGATYAPITLLNTANNLAAYSLANFHPIYSPAKTDITTSDFLPMQDFATGANSNPYSVAIGDLDGDGKPDLAVANFGANTISVFHNTSNSGSMGSGSFADKVDFATGSFPVSVAIGDLDGDGKPDLAVANRSSNTVSVFRNTSTSGSIGSGSFAAKVDFATGSFPYSVAIGDLDGDGKPDLAVANLTSNTVSVFRNTSTSGSMGSGSFAAKVDFTTGIDPISVAIGDLDGDGKPDLAVANQFSNRVSVFRNTSTIGSMGSGSFAAKVDFTTGSGPYSVAIGDLDGDGKPDLAVANNGANTVSVFRNTSTSGSIGSGSFAAKVDFTTGSEPYSVAIGDLDGDGKPDLAVAIGANTVSVFRNTSTSGSMGSGSFAAKVDFTTGLGPYSVAIGDFDGDSKPDLAVANQSSNSVSVLRNADIPVPTIASFSPLSAKPGDAVTITGTNFNSTAANNIVFFGATRATVTAATATSVTATVPVGATYAPITLLNTANNLAAYSLANFHPIYSPAKTDITASDFLPMQDFSTGASSSPYSVAIGDLDGDGKSDLVVANNASNSVSIFRNTATSGSIGSSNFAAKVDFATGDGPRSVAIGDLDGDGKPDLVVANNASNSVSIFRNTATSGSIGSGSFAAKVDFATGNNPISVAIGDLDGDGRADLAAANFGSASVSVLHNTSSTGSISAGSFAAKVDFATEPSSRPTSVAIADLDGDGKSDFVVTNRDFNTVSIFRNTSIIGSISAGSFAAKVDFATGANPFSVAIGDLDGDSKPDLAVANISSISVSLLRNTTTSGSIGSGSFAAKVDFATGANPFSVAIGDLDGDSKPDLAVANLGASSFSVFRNTSTIGSIGSSSFAAKQDFATGSSPYSAAIGDLDGDGKPDLVVANSGSHDISVLRNADFTTWGGVTWSSGIPSSTVNAVIASNTVPSSSFASRALIINGGASLSTTGITVTVNGDIINNGNGIVGTGNININANSALMGDTIKFSGTLTLSSGVLTTNGRLVLMSDAAGTGRVGAITGGSVNGNITLQRYIAGGSSQANGSTPAARGFRFFSHPFSTTQSINALTHGNGIDVTGPGGASNGFINNTTPGATNNPSAFWYNASAVGAGSGTTDVGWIPFTRGNGTADGSNPNTWGRGQGIRVLFRGARGQGLNYQLTEPSTHYTANAATVQVTGAINTRNQSISLPAPVVGNSKSWHLVGNPYPSQINIGAVLNRAYNNGSGGLASIAYVYNPNKQNTSRGGYDAIDISQNAAYILPTMGVVVVENIATGSNTIQFAESDKSDATSNLGFRSQAVANQIGIELTDSVGINIDEHYVRFNSRATDSIDAFDGSKMLNEFSVYGITNNQKLYLNSLPAPNTSTVLPLGIYAARAKQMRLVTTQLDVPVGMQAILRDKWLQQEQVLQNGTAYQFSVTADTASQGNHRFEIVLRPAATLPVNFQRVAANWVSPRVANISWSVGVEQNIHSYEVERSADGTQFNTIGTVPANNQNSYELVDGQAIEGNNYYRVKVRSQGGASKYSQVVLLRSGKGTSGIQLLPNIISQGADAVVQLQSLAAGQYQVQVVSKTGQVVYHKNHVHTGGNASLVLPTQTLVRGGYQVIISNQQAKYVEQMLVQ